jgi:hypothetical protein
MASHNQSFDTTFVPCLLANNPFKVSISQMKQVEIGLKFFCGFMLIEMNVDTTVDRSRLTLLNV